MLHMYNSIFGIGSVRLCMMKVMVIALCLGLSMSVQAADHPANMPFADLRAAYAVGDPDKAAAAYADDALYVELYPGTAPILRSGREAIGAGFSALFAQLGAPVEGRPLDLNFRLVQHSETNAVHEASGFYRLTVGRGRDAERYYGSFAVRWRNGNFLFDASGPATEADFETASGPMMFAPDDEALTGTFYDQLTGSYGDGPCPLHIVRSQWRLFAFDPCTREYRGLERQSGLVWRWGSQVVGGAARGEISFVPGPEPKLVRTVDGKPSAPMPKRRTVRTEELRFGEKDRLAGTLYIPEGATAEKPRAAVVMLHGSGEQDRHGYAAIIALMAGELARSGVYVLAYDKRGAGLSDGDWASASFADLAADARDAMAALASRPGVDPARIAVAGSSQAGWVAAKLLDSGSKPSGVFLLGAAGSAMRVDEQNLYNSEVQMRCAGLADADIKLALDQQRAFFAARRNPSAAARLAQLSAKAARRPAISDWLFPATISPSPNPQWYDVLDPDFDPLPVWQKYQGKALFLFSANDDATDTVLVKQRLARLASVRVQILDKAHHIGLVNQSRCDSDIRALDQMHPDFLPALARWGASI